MSFEDFFRISNARVQVKFLTPFNAQGSRVIILVLQVGAVKVYVAQPAVEALRKKERQDEIQCTHENWWEKLVWVPVMSFCKIFIPSYTFDALLCQNWPFSPPAIAGLYRELYYCLTFFSFFLVLSLLGGLEVFVP